MSFVLRGSRPDLEGGFPGFIPERRAVACHCLLSASVSMLHGPFIRTLSLFLSLLWLVGGVFLMATALRTYATCQQLQAPAAAASGLLGHSELRLHMPSSIALATRGRLQGLRLQLALLDREFDGLDHETLRALDADNVPIASMSEEKRETPFQFTSTSFYAEAFKDHKIFLWPISLEKRTSCLDVFSSYVFICHSSTRQASSSTSPQKKQDHSNAVGRRKVSEDDLSCGVCLERVNVGDLVRSLPCLHQFHANCIDPWLRQQGTCTVCKFRAGSAGHESAQDGMDDSNMV